MNKQTGNNLPGAGPGRPKGRLHKTTALLKDAILAAADTAGGEEGLEGYLASQATPNPGPFLALLGKVLPMTVAGDKDKEAVAAYDDAPDWDNDNLVSLNDWHSDRISQILKSRIKNLFLDKYIPIL